jgi:hypothetical protein
MFEKVSQLAEHAATNASRRQFLGRFGRSALTVAAAAGGILALAAVSHAGRRQPRLCLEDSYSGCGGRLEGFPCHTPGSIIDDGVCQGPKPRGDKGTTTLCGCGSSRGTNL